MSELASIHEKEFAEKPEVVIEVPQAAVLFGSFSELLSGKSLLTAIDGGMTLLLSKREDNVVRIVNTLRQDKKKFNLPNIKYRREDKWANAAKAVAAELFKDGIRFSGMNITIGGPCAGADCFRLSASFFIGVLSGINALYQLGLTKDKMMEYALRANSFSQDYKARHMDLWVLLYAEKGMIYLFDGSKGTMEAQNSSSCESRCFLLNSGLPYSVLTPEEMEVRQYAMEVLELLSSRMQKVSGLKAMSEKEVKLLLSGMPERQRNCAMHLYLGSDYAQKAFDMLKTQDVDAFARLLTLREKSLIDNVELTTPEVEWIFRRGTEHPAIQGLALIDIGIAGTFLCVSTSEKPDLGQIVEEYERIFGFHISTRPFLPSGAVKAIC